MFLRRSLASLARVTIFSVGTFGGGGLAPPPPQYQKAGYATVHPYRSDNFFLLACELVQPENEDPF